MVESTELIDKSPYDTQVKCFCARGSRGSAEPQRTGFFLCRF